LQTVPLDDGRDEGGGQDPSAATCRTEEIHRIREAVYGLPELYREAVCMVHLDGLSYREAAEILGIPVGTLKSRMSSAFQFLRDELGGSFIENVNDGTPAERRQGEVEDEVR
jgi:RNA polymerase sigma-70 factor, ECF subfamily